MKWNKAFNLAYAVFCGFATLNSIVNHCQPWHIIVMAGLCAANVFCAVWDE